jgi:DNA ligase (NAD+)
MAAGIWESEFRRRTLGSSECHRAHWAKNMNPDKKQIDALAKRLDTYNRAYRSGKPLVSDRQYDELVEELRRLDSSHSFLNKVEPEDFDGKRRVRHPVPMLSTEKAYTKEQLARFIKRVAKESAAIEADNPTFQVTPKLDGLAGRDDGRRFATRGNGEIGYEISSAFTKGIVPIGGRGRGVGEIVVIKSYFEAYLADKFEHPRNMVVGIISSDTLNEHARKALADRAVHFVPYKELDKWRGRGAELLQERQRIADDLIAKTDYPVDGVVAEVVEQSVRDHMGATAHHYRWQIAIKNKGDTAITEVVGIQWQVGRTGSVTPVMEVKPVNLSGATIRRVTAHHAGLIYKEKIGTGACIEVIRSGEVIPKLEGVLSPSDRVRIPKDCPSCGSVLIWQKDFLKCTWVQCPAQIEQRISHWFKTLGNADWFGIKTIRRLVRGGYDSLEKIYALKIDDFTAMGFGPVQSRNLAEAIVNSRTRPIDDWRFLAAFGINDLGKGDSRKILRHTSLLDLLKLSAPEIEKIDGFGTITSQSIEEGLHRLRPTLEHMLSLGFQLITTPLTDQSSAIRSPITGKGVVFTGKMNKGSRSELQAEARQLGARVQSAVSGSTDYLVCGKKVGRSKIAKAEKLGVQIITEDAYRNLIHG